MSIKSILYRVTSLLENPTGLARPLWHDFSAWQKLVNMQAVADNGCWGVAMRANTGRYYDDPYFQENYKRAGDAGLWRTSYHVYVPGQSVDAQLEKWFATKPAIDIIPRVLDVEIKPDPALISLKTQASQIWSICSSINKHDGQPPIIYSRKNLIDSWLVPYWTAEQFNSLYWWLAQYLSSANEHPGPPDRPSPIKEERVILHQTSDHKPPPDSYEVATKSVDWDRWEFGNAEEMNTWIRETWGGSPPIPPNPSIPVEIIPPKIVVITASTLNIRSLPDPNSKVVGALKQNSEVGVFDKFGDWFYIGCGYIHSGYTKDK